MMMGSIFIPLYKYSTDETRQHRFFRIYRLFYRQIIAAASDGASQIPLARQHLGVASLEVALSLLDLWTIVAEAVALYVTVPTLSPSSSGPTLTLSAVLILMSFKLRAWPSAQRSWHVLGNLVEQKPIEAQICNGLGELSEFDRLSHIAVRAEPIASEQVFMFVRGGQYDHRVVLRSWVSTDLPEDFQSIDFRQF